MYIDGNWKALFRYAVGSKIVCINNNNDILICDLRVGYNSNDRWKKINIHPYTSEKMFAIRVISSSNGILFFFFFIAFFRPTWYNILCTQHKHRANQQIPKAVGFLYVLYYTSLYIFVEHLIYILYFMDARLQTMVTRYCYWFWTFILSYIVGNSLMYICDVDLQIKPNVTVFITKYSIIHNYYYYIIKHAV